MVHPCQSLLRHVGLVVMCLCLVVGCSTGEDPNLVTDLSTLNLLLADSGNFPQQVVSTTPTYQAVTWVVNPGMATLTLTDGSDPIDFTFQDSCDFADTTLSGAVSVGACRDGIVVGARDTPVTGMLQVTFSAMDVRRAKPVLPVDGDNDGDGFLNSVDICPLFWDEDQSDDNGDGIGDSCSFVDVFNGSISPDADRDGRRDSIDNCVWFANPGQEDTGDLAMKGIADGIGDICVEQIANVTPKMGQSFTIERMVEIMPESGLPSFITLDIKGDTAFTMCDWDMGTCMLDVDQVEVCFSTNRLIASFGCF
ncbi:MAG: thrombospondin type 3 repeat-containing protein [Acidobacteriota bacterium]|nr:thrombospondin type 3 repeat-containing protein [Acidobacteriota bacterium]MDH3784697.1 thrombospondin type 3 repeat-containing protein [Acidobacteriota bacterium]